MCWMCVLSGATARRIPLPASLSGTTEERCIVLDAALFFIVSGALLEALEAELQPTGILTADDARIALETAFEGFQNG